MENNLKKQLEGISAITVTPFSNKNGHVDVRKVKENVRFLVDNDIKVIVPCGNTGVYYSLTLEECETVTKTTLQVVEKQASVLVGVGHDTQTAIKQSLFAQENGASGVMIHQPVHTHIKEEGLINYYKEIANAIDIDVVLYVKSNTLTINGYKELQKVKNIVGIKYSLPNVLEFGKIVEELKNWDITWVCGLAESWAPFFYRAGGKGFTSGLVNVTTKKSQELLQYLQECDNSSILKLWNDIRPFEELRAKYEDGNNVAVVKQAMNILFGNYGEVRPPVNYINSEEEKELRRILSDWGLI